ncbi:MAG: hypothetical protein JSV93_01615 [Candidatus Omnitrophota bacterium]|nr:MAG: hypothetical protein JSV93_01615 [Candidatus Omnitrophota bacterium]
MITENKLDPNKIKLSERYAYSFDNYLGSTGEPWNNSRVIEQNAILRRRYNPAEKVRLTPGIINHNEGIPLEEATIELIFGQGIVVEDCKRWTVQEVNGRYSWEFRKSINNRGRNSDDSIFIRFPRPDRYLITAVIDGKYLDGRKEVSYSIELYE